MNIAELAQVLEREGYSPSWYSFDKNSPPVDGYILDKEDGRWRVFYFERGTTREIAAFESEAKACEFFYEKMKKGFSSALNGARH